MYASTFLWIQLLGITWFFILCCFQRTDFEETGNIQKTETKTHSSSMINPDLWHVSKQNKGVSQRHRRLTVTVSSLKWRYLEVEVHFFCTDQIPVNSYVQNSGFSGLRGTSSCLKRDYGRVHFYIVLICFRRMCLNYYMI